MRSFLLSSSSLVFLIATPALADERPLSPRIDTGLKLGTERGIVTTEIWLPVRQAPDRVLYGDVRLSGDDQDNFEGNLGGGYRHIYGDTVLGAHGWIDRRKTARGSTFSQVTVGVEALGKNIDARLNAYAPLSGSKTYATPNAGRDEPYLAGSGVFYDTAGRMVEEPQGGFDIELGARLPLFEESVDTIRVYGGFYHFGGDETPDVTGWRARVSADITPQLQLGARFQKDSERGSQGFLEATLRFPGKASFRREGLRARLDESPERDVDIVTGAAVTDSGHAQPVLNESGDPQRVLHVDNTNSDSGNGTKDNPYSTLKAAEAAMKPYDVIYIHEGDGTTTGQNLGIIIDKPHVKLIGSGVDLVVENDRVTGAAAGTTTGAVLAAATAAPMITNTVASGDGVLVTADAGLVSGIAVQGAQRDGVRIWANGPDAVIGSGTVRDLTATANAGRGVLVYALAGGRIGTAAMEGIASQSNTGGFGRGVEFRAEGAGSAINRAEADGINASGNAQHGAVVYAVSGGRIDAAELEGVTASGNAQQGVLAYAVSGGRIGTATLSDVTSSSNALPGVQVIAQSGGQIGAASLDDIISANNAGDGIRFQADGVGSTITTATVSGVTSESNTGAAGRGILVHATNSGRIGAATLSEVTSSGNAQQGVWIYALSGGQIGTASLEGITSQGNTGGSGRGVEIRAEGAGSAVSQAVASAVTAQNNASFGMYAIALNGGQIGTATLSDVTSSGNAVQGTMIQASGGVITDITVQDLTTTGNTWQGLYLQAINNGQILSSSLRDVVATGNSIGIYALANTNGALLTSLERVTATGNASNGVYVDVDAAGAFTADLGGGTLGSTGGNRIYGNTGTDLRVDLDGGQLKAENNWWGNAAGLLPARVTLDAGGNTVDADPFLAADPGL